MPVTAVKDRLILLLPEVKSYLRITHNEDDDLLNVLIEAAKEELDAHLQNEFTEEDEQGNVLNLDIPFKVRTAALKIIATLYEARRNDVIQESAGGHAVTMGVIPLDAYKLIHSYVSYKGRLG